MEQEKKELIAIIDTLLNSKKTPAKAKQKLTQIKNKIQIAGDSTEVENALIDFNLLFRRITMWYSIARIMKNIWDWIKHFF